MRAFDKQLSGPVNNYAPEKYESEGALQEMEGNNDAALQNYLKAVDLLEQDRRRLGSDQVNGQLLNDQISIYYEPAMQYLDRGEYAKAFELLERSRGRAMADLMYSRQVTLNNPQDQALFAQSVELEAKLAAAQNKLFNGRSYSASYCSSAACACTLSCSAALRYQYSAALRSCECPARLHSFLRSATERLSVPVPLPAKPKCGFPTVLSNGLRFTQQVVLA